MTVDQAAHRWFLTPDERGNPTTDIDQMGEVGGAWIDGNLVRPAVHGATYFRRLYDELTRYASAIGCTSPTGAATPMSCCCRTALQSAIF